MQLDFLGAHKPLCKSLFRNPDGSITKEDYPLVKRFTSYRETANNPKEFYKVMKTAAEKGRCLLKGLLNREITDESRAGTHERNGPTEWIVLDVDTIFEGMRTREEFITKCLPPEFWNVTYIWQPSTRTRLTPDEICGHMFFMLDKPANAFSDLKEYLMALNMKNSRVRDKSTLASGNMRIRYAIDPSVAQNDKLIYIARPKLNFEDPIKEQFELVKGSNDFVSLDLENLDPAWTKEAENERIDELRAKLNLPKKRAKIIFDRAGHEILTNPDRCRLKGVQKHTRMVGNKEVNIVYLHLQNSDSPCRYWHYEDDFELLHDFNGYVSYRMRDIVPEYFRELLQAKNNPKGDVEVIVGRDFETDEYFNALYWPKEKQIEVAKAGNAKKLADFAAQYNAWMPDPIPDFNLTFAPTEDWIINRNAFPRPQINRYCKTEYIKEAERLGPASMPPTIEKVIRSVTGGDEESYEHFINWMAWMYQKRKQPNTAWILHGIEGTGKGLLRSRIITPTLGAQYVVTLQIHQIEKFNGYLRQALLIFIDEAEHDNAPNSNAANATLRQWIGDSGVGLRAMRSDLTQVKLYCSVIFASNKTEIIEIQDSDRRYNVAAKQKHRLLVTERMLEKIDKELLQFSRFIMHFPLDEKKATRCLENEAKEQLRSLNRNGVDEFCKAIRDSNLEFFLSFRNDAPNHRAIDAYTRFQNALSVWIDNPGKVTRSQLKHAYGYIQGGQEMTDAKFTRMLALHGITLKRIRDLNGKLTQGLDLIWDTDPEIIKEYLV